MDWFGCINIGTRHVCDEKQEDGKHCYVATLAESSVLLTSLKAEPIVC